jgi:hypothetical protein
MGSQTLKIVTIMVFSLVGIVWAWISIQKQAMYIPPTEIQALLAALLAGKYADGRMAVREAKDAKDAKDARAHKEPV